MNQRVLFITPGLTKGGAETQLMKVVDYLTSQNKEVVVLALKPINDFNLERVNVVFLKNWRKNPLSNILNTYRMINDFRPTVVVAFMFAAILFARLLKLTNKFTLISSIRTPVLDKKWYTAFKNTSRFDDVVVYNSESSKSVFETNNLSKKNGIVINNSISLPASSNPPKDPNGCFVWCCVAHFRPEKDYVTLFKAISMIKGHDFRVDILGHLGTQTWPMETVKDLQIENKIRLLGFQKNVAKYLEQADAFVLSTRWEGSPNSILEAMSYSKPVVASSVLGIEDLINDSHCGFLFKSGDAGELSERMVRMMEMSSSDRNVLGSSGRKFVETNYAEESVMKKWLSVIYSNEVIERELVV